MSVSRCHVPRSTIRRLIRYGSVSAISTVTSLSILGVLVGLVGFSAIWSNVIATAVGTVPSFELNRRWVWSHDGPRSLSRQALPYCLLAFTGLVLSTVSVNIAADATASWTRFMHTAAVEFANFGAYGTLWVIQFFLCDRILFKPRPHQEGAELLDDDTPQRYGVPPTVIHLGEPLQTSCGVQSDCVADARVSAS
jgi:putative flippase GtrA